MIIEQYKNVIRAAESQNPVRGLTHNFYRYPARFSHEFAAEVISCFSKPGDHVLDPFMGGGTAIVEALALGRCGTGVDLNELAHFVASVKTTPLSQTDREVILDWLSRYIGCDVSRARQGAGRVINLPYHIQRLFDGWLARVDQLPEMRQRRFMRCALLNTGQRAIDCREQIPAYPEIRLALERNVSGMLIGLDELVQACQASGTAKNKITVSRRLLCRSAVGIEKVAGLRNPERKVRLVVTSPPYYGVHVIYHRWQVKGRRETAAPYWIASLNDGNPLSYYTFGSRRTQLGLTKYFDTLLGSFRSIREVMHQGGIVVQLVSFERTAEQLPRYLETMKLAGYRELDILVGESGQRVWRNVPNRKWYSRNSEEHDSSKEVVLFHRAT